MELSDAENDVYATTDALIKGALLHVYIAYLTSQTHGQVFDFDDGTAMAMHLTYNMLHTHKIMADTALSQNYDQQNENYMNDRVMFMRQWPYFRGVAEGNAEWFEPNKVAIALPPAGPAGRGSWWGGWGFTVPAYAPNPDGAKELIKFLTSNEIAPRLAEGQGFFITPRASIMAVLEGTGNAMVDAMSWYAREGVPRPRPFHPRIVEAQNVVDDMASLYLTKQETLANVLKTGRELIADLG
jgi:ABC-type glycerol-3-phosphate transport system substrate-binding protein